MLVRPARLVRQRFGIVRIAAGAFEDLAALDVPETIRALTTLRAAEARLAAVAELLRGEAFEAVRGCDDAPLRRRLLAVKRDLFNGRKVDAAGLPHAGEYEAAVAEADAAHEQFLRAFESEVADARDRLRALAASEALQRPLARSSLALLAEIRRGLTRQSEAGVMKYVTRMHAKTSPFSTFCHVAPAVFGPVERDVMSARLGRSRVSVQANRVEGGREEERFYEDSVLCGEVVLDEKTLDQLTETMDSYVQDLAFSDPAKGRRAELRCEFEARYGREGVVPLRVVCDGAQTGVSVLHGANIERWTAALASRLRPDGDRVYVDRQHVDHAFDAVPELRRELPRSVGAMLQFSSEGVVLNGCGPGLGKQVSRFLHLMPEAMLEEQRAINRAAAGASRLVEANDGSLLNINLHPRLVDGAIDGDEELVVKIGDDDTLWLWDAAANQRIEVVDLGLQNPAARSPLHRFLNAHFSPAQELLRKPLVNAALAAWKERTAGVSFRPRVIYDRRLVIRRKSWKVAKAMLPIRAKGESDAAYFARVDAWREDLGMPAYVFAKVRRTKRRDDRKPQFISFASWHSVMLLEKLFARVVDTLKFQEMLPTPADMLEWDGRRHAVEFVVQWNRGE